MTYQEFKNKYNGKYVDFDGAYGYQCWDLAQLYFTQVLGVPSSVLSGCGWVGKMLVQPKRAELDKYFNEVSTIGMQQGDVCIWSDPKNVEKCHIAIFDHWNSQDNNCYYFSQNPNPCQVMPVNMVGHHAFRLKKEELAQPVARDEYKNQIEVKVDDLRVRACGSTKGDILGKAKKGFYNYYEKVNNEGYTWYRITNDWRSQWIASNPEWTTVYPAKETFKVGDVVQINGKYKVVDIKNDNVLVWVPFKEAKKQ